MDWGSIKLCLVTSDAGQRSRGKVAFVTGRTLQRLVGSLEFISGSGMVESRGFPGSRCMAGCTFLWNSGSNVARILRTCIDAGVAAAAYNRGANKRGGMTQSAFNGFVGSG